MAKSGCRNHEEETRRSRCNRDIEVVLNFLFEESCKIALKTVPLLHWDCLFITLYRDILSAWEFLLCVYIYKSKAYDYLFQAIIFRLLLLSFLV